jgi:hypothetical protein
LVRRLVFHNVGGLRVETLGGGVDALEIASLYRSPGTLAQELPKYALDEGGAGLLRSGDAVDGGQDVTVCFIATRQFLNFIFTVESGM